ncbi:MULTISPECIES: aminoglycoside phosphotransferase family protein [Microbacterium]|uniref:aminoglycoside phosphotransferase family protein n=1 Tax=Microbacterium TaxID=33882 RepID=UPI002785FFF2|nr:MULTISPECIES: aminoglycoside phosphotransferase family protein [Microbacterium]MDQ1084515.1 aminoglycoside phosphotransferase (APT) family kinase protein [Microbacterium sp. SORGH_AS_0344]MDQ1170208.1 aminoglycoside phosphotransferase (APT) family kinase protein [Microbacterium proteolyticum]
MSAAFPARDAIDEALVRALVREQFPQWAGLPVAAVRESGNDHRTFRLGDALVARLPADLGFVPQVAKEQKYLPFLAPHLPVPIPAVAGVGRASALFPAPWSVYGWLAGIRPDTVRVRDDVALAERLAHVLVALRRTDATGGPAPGQHSAFRGDPVSQWDEQVTRRFDLLDGSQRDRARGVWRDALAVEFTGPPVWLHGDVAIGNLLVDTSHRLSAVIDFGCSAVGDPACDTVIHWTQFRGPARRVFRDVLDLDDATWARGAGWTLWKGLIMLTNITPGEKQFAERVLGEVLSV